MDKDAINEYLEMLRSAGEIPDSHYGSPADFLLREGERFEWARRPRWCLPGPPRHCFANAAALVSVYPRRVDYAEGYAVSWDVPFPLLHGWCVSRRTGKVIDPTWDRGVAYFGVRIAAPYLERHHQRSRSWSLINNWLEGYPLLREDASGILVGRGPTRQNK